jgi:hypothetical protein
LKKWSRKSHLSSSSSGSVADEELAMLPIRRERAQRRQEGGEERRGRA